jgi:hypothetical protein
VHFVRQDPTGARVQVMIRPNPIPLRPESIPGRFEVWEANSSRTPQLEGVYSTAVDAMRAVDSLFAEWGSYFVAIDTHQVDRQSQCFYRKRASES